MSWLLTKPFPVMKAGEPHSAPCGYRAGGRTESAVDVLPILAFLSPSFLIHRT